MATIRDLKSFIAGTEGNAAKLYKNGNKTDRAYAEKIKSETGSLAQLFTIERAFI
jgi:hypothetical protein